MALAARYLEEAGALAEPSSVWAVQVPDAQSAFLDEILQTMAQGVVVFDDDERLVAFNQQFVSLFEFPPGFVKPGVSLADVMRNRAERGLCGEGDVEEHVRQHVARAKVRTERSGERSLPNGKVYIFQRKPMSGGGFVTTFTDITKRKETERKLRESEQKFRGAFDNAGVGISIRSADGTMHEHNRVLCEMLGFSADELQFKRMRDLAHPDDDPETTSIRHVGFGGRDTQTVERRFIRKDGKVIWCNINYKSLRDADGRPLSTIGMYQDITERKRAEQEAAEKSRLLEATFRNMVQGVAVYGRNHDLVAFNPRYAEILELPPDFLHIGMNRRKIMRYRAAQGHYAGLDTEAKIDERLANALECETSERTLPGGRIYSYDRRAMPGGGYISTVTDLTERRRADALSHRLGRILDNSFNEIYVFDTVDYRFSQVSKGALSNLGFSLEEMTRLCPWDIKPRFTEKSFKVKVEPLLRGETEQLLFESKHRRKDGTRYPVEVRLQLSSTELPPMFVAIIADISGRKRAERIIKDEKRKAEIANQCKSEFLANMSHELRTPLNAVIGFSEVMMQEGFDLTAKDQYLEYVQGINASGQHLLGLINDILDLSKVEAGKVELHEELFDTLPVIRSCLNMIGEQAKGQRLRLVENFPARLPKLRADPRMFRQILLNVLSNAVKFTPAEGKITVKAWRERGGGYALQIADTGLGVAPADIPRILEPFAQIDSKLSRKHRGTGLGLALVKNLAELHGGSLDFRSKPGVGSTVTVRFPKDRLA